MIACSKPCKECPFMRGSLPGWLGPWTHPKHLVNFVLNSEEAFPCHMIVGEDDIEQQDVGHDEYPVCAGSLLLIKKELKIPRNLALAKSVREVDKALMPNVMSRHEFVDYHKKP